MTKPDELAIWTIYCSPRDYPGQYIARKWLVRFGQTAPIPTETTIINTDLETIRDSLQAMGLVCMKPDKKAFTNVVESWV